MVDDVFTQAKTEIDIEGPCGRLQARVTGGKGETLVGAAGAVAIVCHPHPLHGGTMDNKVVTTLVRTYRDLGIAAVTFNFRGVGRSEGHFDDARGEVDDLLAVVAWVRRIRPRAELWLAGFSFGSAVAARAVNRLGKRGIYPLHLALVAPAIERYTYTEAVDRESGKGFPCPVCVIQGGRDEVVDAAGVFAWVESLSGPVEVIRFDSAGHFFHGMLVTLKDAFTAKLRSQAKLLSP